MSDYTFRIGNQEHVIDVRCLWCSQSLEDGREETGYTGEGPDWGSKADSDEHPYGTFLDYGCGDSPDTNDEGTGSHTPNIWPTWDGHLIVLDPDYLRGGLGGRADIGASEQIIALTDDDWSTTQPVPAGIVSAPTVRS